MGLGLASDSPVYTTSCHFCCHLVNTSSQISTVQDSYLALSYPVKSPLATLPASNPFFFCTNPLSIRASVSRTYFALSRHSPLSSNSFIYRFYAKFPSISFIYRIYANHTGWPPSKERKNERHTTQHHQRTCNHRNSPLPVSLPGCCRRAAKPGKLCEPRNAIYL